MFCLGIFYIKLMTSKLKLAKFPTLQLVNKENTIF